MSIFDWFRRRTPAPMALADRAGDEDRDNRLATQREQKPATPYLDARVAFATLSGSHIASSHLWQMVAILALLIAIAAVAGNVHQASRSTMVPYVIQVDKLGTTAIVGRASEVPDAQPAVLQSFLAAWVANARLVTPDTALQRESVFNVYALLGPNDPALKRINAYYGREGEGDPFARAARESVEIQIETVLPLTKDSWQVDWIETVRDRQGARRTATARMRATLQVYQLPLNRKTTEEQMRRNPLGIFVKDFTWAKQLDPLPASAR